MQYKIGDIVKYNGAYTLHNDKTVKIKDFSRNHYGEFICIVELLNPSLEMIEQAKRDDRDVTNWRVLPKWLGVITMSYVSVPDELFTI